MIRFKREAIEQRLEEHKPQICLSAYRLIKRTVNEGAEGIDPHRLSRICRDLECLPADIVEFI